MNFTEGFSAHNPLLSADQYIFFIRNDFMIKIVVKYSQDFVIKIPGGSSGILCIGVLSMLEVVGSTQQAYFQ